MISFPWARELSKTPAGARVQQFRPAKSTGEIRRHSLPGHSKTSPAAMPKLIDAEGLGMSSEAESENVVSILVSVGFVIRCDGG